MKCPKCGAEIPDGVDICPMCGASIEQSDNGKDESQQSPYGSAQNGPVNSLAQNSGMPNGPQNSGMPNGPQNSGMPNGPQNSGMPNGPQNGGMPNGPMNGGMPNGPQNGRMPNGPMNGGMPNGPMNGGMPNGPQNGRMPNGPMNGGMPNGPMNGGMPNGPMNGGMPNGPQNGGMPNGPMNGGMPNGPMNGRMPNAPRPQKPPMDPGKKKKLFIIIGISAAVVVLVAALLIFLGTRRVNVDLNKYLDVNYSGYNGDGTAEVKFDSDKFEKDYKGKIKLTSKFKRTAKLFGIGVADTKKHPEKAFLELADPEIYASVTPEDKLSNGDTVTISWDDLGSMKETIEECFRVNLSASDKTEKVSGLDEVGKFDPFDGVTVKFDGVAPYISASIEGSDKEGIFSSYDYEIDKNEGLSNGDTITVSVPSDEDSFLLDEYGKIPSSYSKKFKVSGMNEYVSKADQIPADTLDAMKAQAESVIDSKVADEYQDGDTFNGKEFIGTYFMVPKKADQYSSEHNYMWLVYKAHGSNENTPDFTYYYAIGFKDLELTSDGKCNVDVTDYDLPYSDFYPNENEFNWYTGYKTLDDLHKDIVDANSADWTVEEAVTDTPDTATQTDSE